MSYIHTAHAHQNHARARARTHTRTHARTYTHTHTRTHTHTHTQCNINVGAITVDHLHTEHQAAKEEGVRDQRRDPPPGTRPHQQGVPYLDDRVGASKFGGEELHRLQGVGGLQARFFFVSFFGAYKNKTKISKVSI